MSTLQKVQCGPTNSFRTFDCECEQLEFSLWRLYKLNSPMYHLHVYKHIGERDFLRHVFYDLDL